MAERDRKQEEKIYKLAEEYIEDLVVRKLGDESFGLHRCECVRNSQPTEGKDLAPYGSQECEECLHAPKKRVAGWLALDSSNKTMMKAVMQAKNIFNLEHDAWNPRYCVYNLETKQLELYKKAGDSSKGSRAADVVIPIETVKVIEACGSTTTTKGIKKTAYSLQLWYIDERRKDKDVRQVLVHLKPLVDGDVELLARWVALLLYHSKRFDHLIETRAQVLESRITSLQQRVRRWLHARRTLEQLRQQLEEERPKRVSSFMSYVERFGFTSQSSPSEKDLHDESNPSDGAPSEDEEDMTSIQRRSRSNSASAIPGGGPLMESHRWVPPLAPGEEEDEVWENERWNFLSLKDKNLVRGWSHAALFPQERNAFSDRVGNPVGKSFEAIMNLPAPPGWQITTPFVLDTSGLARALCDADGWRYETQFNALDSKQAKGVPRRKESTRWLVRHRRWYRRRIPLSDVPEDQVARPPRWILYRGWLGMRGLSTGVLWRSRYCFVALPVDPENTSGRPSGLSVAFLGFFSEKMSRVAMEDNMNDVQWKELSASQLKLKPLDADCRVDDSIATMDNPGYFHVHLSGEKRPRLFNADSTEERVKWVNALRKAIAESKSVQETLKQVEEDVRNLSSRSLGSPSSRHSTNSSENEDPRSPPLQSRKSFVLKEYSKRGFDSLRKVPSGFMDTHAALKARGSQVLRSVRRKPNNEALDEQQQEDSEKNEAAAAQEGTELPTVVEAQVSEAQDEDEQGFEEPRGLENQILEHEFQNIDAESFFHLLFVKDEFHDKAYQQDGFTMIERTEWSSGLQQGSERQIKYLMPRNGPVPQNRAFLTWRIVQACPKQGYQLEQIISNPEVPYGKTFNTRLRYVLLYRGNSAVHLKLTHEIEFLQSTMMKAFIRGGGTREVRNAFQKKWIDMVQNYIDNQGTKQSLQQSLLPSPSPQEGPATPPMDSFEMPPLYQNLVIDVELDVEVDVLNEILFQDDGFQNTQFLRDRAQELSVGDWSQGVTAGSVRRTRYVMPRNGPIPRNTVFLTAVYEQAVSGVGFQIDQESSNPEVPFGKTFVTKIRLVLMHCAPSKTRLIVSQQVDFKANTFMKPMIRAGTTKEIQNVFQNKWLPDLQSYVKVYLQEKKGQPSSRAVPGGPAGVDLAQDKDKHAQQGVAVSETPSDSLRGISFLDSPRLLLVLVVGLTLLVVYLQLQIYRIQQQQVQVLHLLLQELRSSREGDTS